MTLFIGLISGTSIDGIDAALATFAEGKARVLTTCHEPYPSDLRRSLLALCEAESAVLDDLFTADVMVGECFAHAANRLIDQSAATRSEIRAIGSHGQTIRHAPLAPHPYTVQLGDPNVIAERTGIATVADLRRRDLAAGGQGAPLAPAFHAFALAPESGTRAVINIGGIANVTLTTSGGSPVTGYDTGPGNVLMDGWIRREQGADFDHDGAWAASGEILPGLLETLSDDPYFRTAPPKSTGRERFNLAWVQPHLRRGMRPVDVQRTLCELSACTIADAILRQRPAVDDVLVCGGGVHNRTLIDRLRQLLAPRPVDSTMRLGLDPDWLEAVAFAWLAARTLAGEAGNLPAVTGATHPVILGGVYAPSIKRPSGHPMRRGLEPAAPSATG